MPTPLPPIQPRFGWFAAVRRLRPLFAALVLPLILGPLPLVSSGGVASGASSLPVRGIHLMAPSKRDFSSALDFIRNVLPKEGVNTLILEFDYQFDFKSRPEFADSSALGAQEVGQIAEVCQAARIELIPQINCLGHQSWSRQTGRLLQKHPEFDETPGKYPENKDIYCRSYCPLHPEVHQVLFDLIDELVRACQAKAFHAGMDEVFILADPDCPRCRGKSSAEVFATEVKAIHEHLQKIHCQMWMWGDRFLDGKATKLGKWEASENGTESAVDHVPKDIVICDWHYDRPPDTAEFFAGKGFPVVECPWRKSAVALGELNHIRTIRSGSDKAAAEHALGMVETTWCGFSPFARAYAQQHSGGTVDKNAASEAANCFSVLFKALREGE